MPATVTLSTTTLSAPVTAYDPAVTVASTTGLTPGTRLWVDRELMSVVSVGVSNQVNVVRGVDGTSSSPHYQDATITIGRGDQFYQSDPLGTPPAVVLVSPYINVVSGDVWYAQGNSTGGSPRWWQKQANSYDTGTFGIQTITPSPTAST